MSSGFKRSTMLGFFAALLIGGVALGGSGRPNVVFILADDLGCRDLSGEGSTFYESPHIDSIAERGVRFTQGYAACQVCSPSRAALMTGKYPARLHITDWIGAASGYDWTRNGRILPVDYVHALPQEETTLAEALGAAGYRTFFAGKWHLGDEGSWPDDHGFDINLGGHHRGSPPGGFFAPFKNPVLADKSPGESLPLRLGRETADFIHEMKDDGRPFLAYLSFYSVHGPIQTTEGLWKKYQQKATDAGLADSRFVIDRTLPVRQVQDCPIYAGMIESMDDAVGLVLEALSQTGADDNTIIVFTSDNGGVSSGDAFSTSNLPFRGGKGRQWEGGLREPYYICGPGVDSGKVCETPVTGTDFYPTILDLCGLPLLPDQHVDGVSLSPLLRGESIPDRNLYWHYPHYGNQGGEPSSIVRSGNWKLIHYWEDGRDELYHLGEDLGEQSDLSLAQPAMVAKLRADLFRWLGSVRASIPAPDPRYSEERSKATTLSIQQKRLPALERQHRRFLNSDYQPNADWWGSARIAD